MISKRIHTSFRLRKEAMERLNQLTKSYNIKNGGYFSRTAMLDKIIMNYREAKDEY